ncbi:MAG: murein biosynthesis integral membrane protein MurJ [Actinomycetaceae bacterium]
MSGRRGLAGSSMTMFAGTLVSRVLGLVKGPVLLVAVLGANTGSSNAFDVANKLPNLIYMLVAGGVLNAVLVPQIVRAMTKDKDGGEDYVSRLLTAVTLALGGLTVVLTFAAPLLVRLFAFGMTDPWYSQSVAFAYWCIPQLFFYGMYTLLGQVLNARGIFGPYTWAPVLNNVVAIAGLLLFISMFGSAADMTAADADQWDGMRTWVLAGTATAGVMAQALVLIWPLRKAGVRLRPRFGFRGRGLGSATSTAMWVFAALLVGQVATLLVSNVAAAASARGEYAIDIPGNAAYTNAYFLYSLPTSLIVVSLITALFTRMSTNAATSDLDAVRADLSLGLRVVGMFTVFCSGGLMVLALPLVRVITPAAQFVEVRSIAMVLVALLTGLVGVGAFTVIQRVYYAFEDARRLFFLQLPLTAIGVAASVASLLLPPRWVLVGACAGMALSNIVGAALSYLGLRPRLGWTDGGTVVRAHVRICVAAAPAIFGGWGLLTLMGTEEADMSLGGAMVRLLVIGVLMVLVYFVTLRALGARELEVVARPMGTMVASIGRRLPGPARWLMLRFARVLNPSLPSSPAPSPTSEAASHDEPTRVGDHPGDLLDDEAPDSDRSGRPAGTHADWTHADGTRSNDGSTSVRPQRREDPNLLWSAENRPDATDMGSADAPELPWSPPGEGAWETAWTPGRRNRPSAAGSNAAGPTASAPDPGAGSPRAGASGTGASGATARGAASRPAGPPSEGTSPAATPRTPSAGARRPGEPTGAPRPPRNLAPPPPPPADSARPQRRGSPWSPSGTDARADASPDAWIAPPDPPDVHRSVLGRWLQPYTPRRGRRRGEPPQHGEDDRTR